MSSNYYYVTLILELFEDKFKLQCILAHIEELDITYNEFKKEFGKIEDVNVKDTDSSVIIRYQNKGRYSYSMKNGNTKIEQLNE